MKSRFKPPTLSKREAVAAYKFISNDVACNVLAAVLYVLYLRGWHKERIVKLFNDVIDLLDRPPVLGKQLKGGEVMEFITEKYGIDFDRVNLKWEEDNLPK